MEVQIIKGKERLGNINTKEPVRLLRVAAYCRVSTDEEEQIKSYNSMVRHYTDYILQNKEWIFAGVYADKAITGTKADKRENFQRLITDCMDGRIDLVITKSLPRFARNTLDTLKYVRMLREKNIGVYFEVEKIHTLKDGEFLMTILSSVAQQEVENTSAYVKKGLKMKMQRGEIVGFAGCMGYDYDPETKTLTINETEAEIVRFIFQRYLEGAGSGRISRELNEQGRLTRRGNLWCNSAVMDIIKNEKYKGDMLLGKTYTVDPISKRRLLNMGEEDRFYVKNHHEPIISEQVFDMAQDILNRRGQKRNVPAGQRQVMGKKYAFSSICYCGFCGSLLSRRNWYAGKPYERAMWNCAKALREGKNTCPHSRNIAEEIMEKAFLLSFNRSYSGTMEVEKEFMQRLSSALKGNDLGAAMEKENTKKEKVLKKQKSLLEKYLADSIPKKLFEETNQGYETELTAISSALQELDKQQELLSGMALDLESIRALCNVTPYLETFDREIFECAVSQVVLGKNGDDENHMPVPFILHFYYKDGKEDCVMLTEEGVLPDE